MDSWAADVVAGGRALAAGTLRLGQRPWVVGSAAETEAFARGTHGARWGEVKSVHVVDVVDQDPGCSSRKGIDPGPGGDEWRM